MWIYTLQFMCENGRILDTFLNKHMKNKFIFFLSSESMRKYLNNLCEFPCQWILCFKKTVSFITEFKRHIWKKNLKLLSPSFLTYGIFHTKRLKKSRRVWMRETDSTYRIKTLKWKGFVFISPCGAGISSAVGAGICKLFQDRALLSYDIDQFFWAFQVFQRVDLDIIEISVVISWVK